MHTKLANLLVKRPVHVSKTVSTGRVQQGRSPQQRPLRTLVFTKRYYARQVEHKASKLQVSLMNAGLGVGGCGDACGSETDAGLLRMGRMTTVLRVSERIPLDTERN